MIVFSLFLAAPVGATPEDVHTHPMTISDEELFGSLDLDHPGLEAVKDSASRRDYRAAAEAWAAYWRERERPTIHFHRAEWPSVIRQDYRALGQAIIEQADRVAAGELTHGTVRVPVDGTQIDWLHNPNKDTSYVSLVGSYWFLTPMGRAYLLTGDEKHARAFVWIYDSWYDHQAEIVEHQGGLGFNPVFRAYYPGIRARILVDNYYCLAKSPSLTPELHVKLMKGILGASAWLYADNGGYKVGNQQVAAVMGMTVAGMVIPEFRQSEVWVERGVQRMREHLERDFFPDGAHRELCTQYHKTCLRDMSYVALTAQRNGLPSFFDEDDPSAAAFERAYEWLARVVMPSALTPPIHSAVFANDYAVHLQTAGEQFNRPDFLWLADRVWKKGIAPSQKGSFGLGDFIVGSPLSAGDREAQPPSRLSDHLPESGFAIMRTGWKPDDRYLILQYGWPNTGHAYPGALHFCLAMNGEVIATSPGSPRSYTLPSYRYCHSTPAHNVISIDGKSYKGQRGIAPGGTLHKYVDDDAVWYVRASHEGYADTFGAVHERQILVIKDGPIIIRDVITGGAGHQAQWNFHTPLEVQQADPGRLTLKGNERYTLCVTDPDTLSEPKTEMHWSAVPPELCQPDDCGKEVPAITFEREIGEEGVEFVAAIVEGTGEIEVTEEATYRTEWDGGSVSVSFAPERGECAVDWYADGQVARQVLIE